MNVGEQMKKSTNNDKKNINKITKNKINKETIIILYTCMLFHVHVVLGVLDANTCRAKYKF